MKVEYLNENLAPGHLGYFFVVLSFCAALFAFISYIFYFKKPDSLSWKRMSRIGFFAHGVGVIGIFCTLFYLIYHHQFQYNYVWAHSSLSLPAYYMIAGFWEGQEGSFLLWTIWQVVLGCILVFTARQWEAPVMLTICLAQLMLAGMLLGANFDLGFLGQLKLGSNPFILLRNSGLLDNAPAFHLNFNVNNPIRPDYVSLIKDGRGLNILLQNYWMVIHPPVLFLGFASTVVPFAFAMGGLWSGKFGEWVKPAIPWTVFGCMALGTGILMGGAWAYEALSFGGFWAWDPVENASLVPWLLFIAGLHCMLIFKARKSSLIASVILITLTYLLVLYSTFLTRSGILGDSSVHSFTDLGLSGQLLLFMFGFVFLALITLILTWKKLPRTEKEESTWSREFWMFIGALVFCLSAIHITVITSIPVFNKISGGINHLFNTNLKTDYAQPADIFDAFHVLQIPFAIAIVTLIGIAQYLQYYKTVNKRLFWVRILRSVIISLVLTAGMAIFVGLSNFEYLLLMWSSFFAVVVNADYFITLFKNKNTKLSGSAVAHIGFGILMLGALISNARKDTISINTENYQALNNASKKEQRENKVLFKNFPVFMQDYRVTYFGDSSDKDHIYYHVRYEKMDKEYKNVLKTFTLNPYVILDKEKGQITTPSPSTYHYLTKDIFTHITAAANTEQPEFQVKYDTSFTFQTDSGEVLTLADSFTVKVLGNEHEMGLQGQDTVYRLKLNLVVSDGAREVLIHPAFELNGSDVNYDPVEVREFGLKFFYKMIHPEADKKQELLVMKGNRPAPEFITMKAIVFPMINLLWLGALIMIIGFIMSIYQRVNLRKAGKA